MSKHAHTPASAANGIEHAIRMLEGRWKILILFHLFGGKTLRFTELERAIPKCPKRCCLSNFGNWKRTAS